MKRCSDCNELKPLDDYHRSSANKDGHTSQCKPCHLAYCRLKRSVTCEDCGVEYYKRNKYAFCPHCDKPRKTCTECGKTKLITQFYNNKNAKDGRQSVCLMCRARTVKDPRCERRCCVFYDTCKVNIKRMSFDPYCFVESKYHGLYQQEYETAGVVA